MSPALVNGYLRVDLRKNGSHNNCFIHRLVAEAYISNPEGLPQVNHKDENKLNNSLNNLEWCSAKENINYGSHNKRVSETKSIPVYCVELDKTFSGQKSAAAELNVSRVGINACLKGRQKTAGGYHWQYVKN